MSEAVNGGKNENKSENKSGALQKFLPGGEAAVRRNPHRAASAPPACVGFCRLLT
jgi:hypothetical protein